MQNPKLEGSSFYWEAGHAGILIVHGFTATTAEVRPLGQYLHTAGYSVSGVLLPGHGTSPEEANRYTWLDWVKSVDQAYQHLRKSCNRVFIAGESLGGLLALYQAAIDPELERVAIYSPALNFRLKWAAPFARLLAPFLPAFKKPASTPSASDALWQGYTVYPLKAMVQLLKFQKIVMEKLPDIQQPLLIIQGRLDRSVDPDVPDLIRSRVKSTRVETHWLDKSGHCVILEGERQQAMELTLKFLQS